MKKQNNIFLIGPMGSGKTSVGKYIAKLSGLTFYDSDVEIEKRTGVSISWIFEVENESGFRDREQSILRELTTLDGIVLSTGGGAIMNQNNRAHLIANGIVVYLKVSIKIQLERTSRRKGVRPLIAQNNPAQKLAQLNSQREPLYEEIADLIYDTDNITPAQLAKKILRDVQKLQLLKT